MRYIYRIDFLMLLNCFCCQSTPPWLGAAAGAAAETFTWAVTGAPPYTQKLAGPDKFPLGLVHQKSPPQVPQKQCFPLILWKILGLVGGFFGGPTQVEINSWSWFWFYSIETNKKLRSWVHIRNIHVNNVWPNPDTRLEIWVPPWPASVPGPGKTWPWP